MSIRLKIVLVVIPLIVATLLLTGFSSYFSATSAITRIAKDFLGFKAQELHKQAESQWSLLVQNNLTGSAEMVSATQGAVEGYARSIIRSPTELIVAVGEDGALAMSTSHVAFRPGEQAAMAARAKARSTDLITASIGGKDRVAKGFWFDPFHWYVLVTEERASFYATVNQITTRTGVILLVSIGAGVVLVLLFAGYLTRPLRRVADTMKEIISTNDLSKRAVVEYQDEIGQLAQTFNLMVDGLEDAYRQIKSYALKAAIARSKEKKIKETFKPFVRPEVIDWVMKNESKISGYEDDVSVMFSHIINFAEVAAHTRPDELVESLEPYFKEMVDAIESRNGMVDKYITDAVMAFFGAPVKRTDDGLRSVLAGIEMTEALREVNRIRIATGAKPFKVSVGLNHGKVIIGTIGTEKKMSYTVIGDPVNLASRLSGLTKVYGQSMIFSASLHEKVRDKLPCRLLDSVAVKGRKEGVKIYTARRSVPAPEKEAWDLHNQGMIEYYSRSFPAAAGRFQEVLRILPGDPVAPMLLKRCDAYARNPPPADWDGVEVMTHK
jgi:adenylate cyclase